MAYKDSDARRIARQIFERFGSRIDEACEASSVPTAFLAGLIGVEAGKDRRGRLREDATRFEAHVFNRLRQVRDGLRKSYNGISRRDLEQASDGAISNLATSFGLTQIMGWHMVKNLRGSIADLRDPDKHLGYAVELLEITAKRYLVAGDYESVLRIWNTGRPRGKTYHASYVPNALKVKAFYQELSAKAESGKELSGEVDLPEGPVTFTGIETTSEEGQQFRSSEEDDPGFRDVAVSTRDLGQSAVETVDQVTRTVETVRRGRDSLKAAISTWSQVIFQPLWALVAAFGEIQWSKWLTVAAIVAIALLAWHHRQLVMGKIRELG